jgi:hypothetical protein
MRRLQALAYRSSYTVTPSRATRTLNFFTASGPLKTKYRAEVDAEDQRVAVTTSQREASMMQNPYGQG